MKQIGISLKVTSISKTFYETAITSGVYGLKDPNTKVMRYVGESKHIEKRYAQHINGARTNWVKGSFGVNGRRKDWIMSLRMSGLVPELVIIKIMPNSNSSDRKSIEKATIEKLLKTNCGADLNYIWSDGEKNNKWRKFLE